MKINIGFPIAFKPIKAIAVLILFASPYYGLKIASYGDGLDDCDIFLSGIFILASGIIGVIVFIMWNWDEIIESPIAKILQKMFLTIWNWKLELNIKQ